MGQRIIKKQDGKFAVWTTICDNFLIDDATEQELYDFLLQDKMDDFREDYKRTMKKVNSEDYNSTQKEYEEMCRIRDDIHGKKEE